jgi:AI-2 transport protein TqsA
MELLGASRYCFRRTSFIATEPRMIYDRSDQNPGANLLFMLACLVVVVYGMRFAASILLPSALALFLTVLSLPVMLWLRERRVPAWIAIVLTVLLNVGLIGLLVMIVSQSVSELQAQLPRYIRQFQELQVSWFNAIESRTDIVVSQYLTTDLVDPLAFIDFARGAVGRVAQFVSMTFLVFLIMAFMLSEAMVFPAKFRFIVGPATRNEYRLQKVVTEIQTYLGIKTVVSLATGLLLGTWAWFMELDFPILLGLIAFLLNYVPTVGSILAALPALLLSLILVGSVAHATLVVLGYVVVNTLFGNILEPSLMGRRLGLSTLVVILSLLFWGWAWGPLGALLSVPLTVVVKIWLENTKDLRWVAVLLDKTPPPDPVDVPEPAPEAG